MGKGRTSSETCHLTLQRAGGRRQVTYPTVMELEPLQQHLCIDQVAQPCPGYTCELFSAGYPHVAHSLPTMHRCLWCVCGVWHVSVFGRYCIDDVCYIHVKCAVWMENAVQVLSSAAVNPQVSSASEQRGKGSRDGKTSPTGEGNMGCLSEATVVPSSPAN